MFARMALFVESGMDSLRKGLDFPLLLLSLWLIK